MHGANIRVFKFYTAENPPHYTFKSHISTVVCVAWLEDDSGFFSTALDSSLYLWKLDPNREDEYN